MKFPRRPPRSRQTDPVVSQLPSDDPWRFWEHDPTKGVTEESAQPDEAAEPVASRAPEPSSPPAGPRTLGLNPVFAETSRRTRPSKTRRTRSISAVLWIGLMAVAGWLILGVVHRAYDDQTRQQAQRAVTAMQSGQWQTATDLLAAATRRLPKDPQVIRAVAQWHSLSGGHPQQVITTLKPLIDQGQVNDEDWLVVARAELVLGRLNEANEALQKMGDVARRSIEVMDFEVRLLREAGRSREATAHFRSLLKDRANDPAATFRLAMLDYGRASDPAAHDAARRSLLRITQGDSAEAKSALEVMSFDAQLTRDEVEELLHLPRAEHPDAYEARYRLFARLLQVTPPDEVQAALGDEMKRVLELNLEPPASISFVSAISAALPPATAYTFAETEIAKAELSRQEHLLQSELLHLTLETLAAQQQWKDVQERLRTAEVRKLGVIPVNLWKACAAAELDPNVQATRTPLQTALAASSAARDLDSLARCAETAARLKQHDLATATFITLAEDARLLPPAQLSLWEKAYASQRQLSDDAKTLLGIARRMTANPAARETHLFEADYLSLLVGESLDPIKARLSQPSTATDDLPRLRHALLKALLQHRINDSLALVMTLKNMPLSSARNLPPGPRGVLVGLLLANGLKDESKALLSTMPNTPLLKAETDWLKRTLGSGED
jgi:hypothetical protein